LLWLVDAPDSPPRTWLAIPAVLLVAIALWEIFATLRAPGGVPDDAAWSSAAKVVRAGFQKGDLIVFAPDWVDPVGRMHLGDLITIDDAARMDPAKYGRIWELAIRGAHSPDTVGLAPTFVRDEDGVEIRRYERTPVTVLADLRELFGTAKIDGAGRATWELAEVGFAPHRCIQAVPGSSDRPLRITFPAVPLGTELVGYVGIADVFTRRDVRDPGQLEVEIAGKVVASTRAGVDDGWVRFAASTTPGTGDITIVVRSRAAARLVCFAVETRK
jgi:hypothetical protein